MSEIILGRVIIVIGRSEETYEMEKLLGSTSRYYRYSNFQHRNFENHFSVLFTPNGVSQSETILNISTITKYFLR